jgi:hypothetical protein
MDGNRSVGPAPDMAVLASDIAVLKRDFATLLRHMETGAFEGTRGLAFNAIGQIGGEAIQLYDSVVRDAEARAQALRRRVEERPLGSLVVVGAVGFLVARLFCR